MENFIEELKSNVDAFELVELNENTDFTSLPEWDSLALLSTMATIASEYGIQISNSQISDCKNIKELFELIKSKQ